jgi:hypothetical protein
VLDRFKIFKNELENLHELKIKIVRSDRGGGGREGGRGSTTVNITHMAKFLDHCEVLTGKWYSHPVFYVR